LSEAGPSDVSVSRRDVTVGAADYASMKEASVEGVLLRGQLTALDWQLFGNASLSLFGTNLEAV
jgi:hypothetical protein